MMIRPESFQYTAVGGVPYLQHTQYDPSPLNRNRLACIVRMIEACGQQPMNILEIGCGVGNIAIPIASLGHRVKAIDAHGPSIEIAKGRNSFSNLQFENIPLENITLKDYDIIILTEVLEHVAPCGDMLRYINLNMRPGARLILTVPNGWGLSEFLLRPSHAMKRWPWGARFVSTVKKAMAVKDLTTANEQTPHIHFFTLRGVNGLLLENGFSPVAFHRFFFVWALIEILFSHRNLFKWTAETDFALSQHLPPQLCATWAFLLDKKVG